MSGRCCFFCTAFGHLSTDHHEPIALDCLYRVHHASGCFSFWAGAFECTKPFIRDRLREGKDVAIFVGGAQESLASSLFSKANRGTPACWNMLKKQEGT